MIPARLVFFTAIVWLVAPALALAQAAPKIEVWQEAGSYRIRVAAAMTAAPKEVWAALTSCERARDFIPHLASCRILESGPDGRWDVRETIVDPPFLPRIRTVVRNDYSPISGFTYRLVSGDLRVSEGSWSVKPTATGARVSYDARVTPDFPAPGFLVTSAIKADLSDMFARLAALAGRRRGD